MARRRGEDPRRPAAVPGALGGGKAERILLREQGLARPTQATHQRQSGTVAPADDGAVARGER